MNVFILSRDHKKRAEYHCDVHVNKLLLEAVQVLNTALHLNDPHDSLVFYQPTHANHPWTKWAADRYANWQWLLDHALALGDEFVRRTDNDSHACIDKMDRYWEEAIVRDAGFDYVFENDGERTTFPQCMPDEYVDHDDVVSAYRDYYVEEKVPQDWCTWSNEVPTWVLERQ